MKIAIDGMLLRKPYSGVEIAIENLIGAVAAEAPHWELLVPVPPDFTPDSVMPENVVFHRAPKWTGLRAGRILWEQVALPGLLWRQGVHLFHAPGYVMPLRWYGPTVLSVYDILALTHPEWCTLPNAAHYRLLVPRSIKCATSVIVPSEQVRGEIGDIIGVAPGKIRVIPLGVDPIFRTVRNTAFNVAFIEAVRSKYALPQEYLLSVGNITPRKNIEGTVSLFERIAKRVEHDLVLVGGKPHRHRHILERVEGSAVRDRIHLLGYVPREELVALYNAASACVHLAHYEGFGLTPLEAMACGTPAIVSPQGALLEVAGPGALVVDASDEEGAAEAVIKVLTDSDCRNELIARGSAHVAQFSWSAVAKKVVALYKEVGEKLG